jgi:hypothetical protein
VSAYFKGGGRFEKTLRFFNLLEPGHMVLSLSKLAVWGTGALVLYVAFFHNDDLIALIGSVTSFSGSLGNYGYRRSKQYQDGSPPYPKTVDTVSAAAQDRALDSLMGGLK